MVKDTQTIRRLLPTDSLSMFDHFVGLTLKGLRYKSRPFWIPNSSYTMIPFVTHIPHLCFETFSSFQTNVMFHFYTHWKHLRTSGFLTFLGWVKNETLTLNGLILTKQSNGGFQSLNILVVNYFSYFRGLNPF